MKKKKYKFSLERKYELEKQIASLSVIENIETLSNEELNYVKGAIKRPYEDFKRFIHLYDKSSPKIDELLFVEFLSSLYNSTKQEVTTRIREVRGIFKIETAAEIEKLRKELKTVERRINIDLKNEENKK